jgi:hypothetical protein
MNHGSFSEWEDMVWTLEGILKDYGITVKSPGGFEEAGLSLTELEYLRQNPGAYDCTVDSREKWRRAMSLADLAEKIVLVRTHPDFPQLVPHLKLLGGESDLSQFSFTTPQNQDNNKVFELYVAAMGLHVLTGCTVDDPVQSKGDNPDIMGQFDGKLWAIACKAMHTTNPKTFCERIAEGVDQIERSAAERGLVMINMKNTVDHDALWPAQIVNGEYYYLTFPTVGHALEPFVVEYKKLQAGAFSLLGSERDFYRHLFDGKKAAPYVLLVYSSISGIAGASGPVFMMLKTINCLCLGSDPTADALANRLNLGLHNQPHAPVVPGVDQPD